MISPKTTMDREARVTRTEEPQQLSEQPSLESILFSNLEAREDGSFVMQQVKSDGSPYYVAASPQDIAKYIHSLQQGNQKLQQENERLKEENITDALTGIHSRRYFKTKLEEEIARADRYQTPFTVLMVDIDHFKQVNDTYGHQEGDRILREVAQVLQSKLRTEDCAARYGGEEFGFILSGADPLYISQKAEELRAAVAENVKTKDGKSVTISIGGADYQSTKRRDVVHVADQMLYAAKNSGRNSFRVLVDKQLYHNPYQISRAA
jgi:diguanylate cyclase (GGDEF)-like protein